MLIGHLGHNEHRFFEEAFTPAWLLAGASGVDLFFVISGLVMVYVTGSLPRGEPVHAGRFLYSRFARIYPAYWLFTAGVLGGYLLAGDTFTRTFGDIDLLVTATLWPTGEPPALLVAWTLQHELYFYLVFAGLLLLPRAALIPALALWLGAVVAASVAGAGTVRPVLGLISHPLTVEFIAGCAIGLLICSGRRRFGALALGSGIAWWAASIALLNPALGLDIPMGWDRVFAWGVPACLIVYGTAVLEIDNGWKTPHPLVVLGDWSYALYLVHLPLVALCARAFGGAMAAAGPIGNLVYLIVTAALSIAAAGLAFRLFERPALSLAKKTGDRFFPVARRPEAAPLAARIW